MNPDTVKVLRTQLGMTQQAFASALGISFVSVNKWENGGSSPTGLSSILLRLLESALQSHSPRVVSDRLRSVGPDPLAIIRTLIEMENRNG